MIKIWAKIIDNNKIIRQTVYQKEGDLKYSEFFSHLSEICYSLDLPTPVLIKSHLFNYAKFNHVRFLKRDFIETVDFDYLLLENIVI